MDNSNKNNEPISERELLLIKRREIREIKVLNEKRNNKITDKIGYRRHMILGEAYGEFQEDIGVFELLSGRKMSELEFQEWCDILTNNMGKSFNIKDYIEYLNGKENIITEIKRKIFKNVTANILEKDENTQ